LRLVEFSTQSGSLGQITNEQATNAQRWNDALDWPSTWFKITGISAVLDFMTASSVPRAR